MNTRTFLDELERGTVQPIGPRACVLRGFALPYVDDLLISLAAIEQVSPFRHMVTPGGFTMSVALTNCGSLGWTTDSRGYRYTRDDPESNQPWPAMPGTFARQHECDQEGQARRRTFRLCERRAALGSGSGA